MGSQTGPASMALVLHPQRPSMREPTTNLQNALTEFRAALSEDQKRCLHQHQHQSEASTVIVFVSEVDAANQQSRKSVASRLCSFLEGVQQFTNVVDTFVSSNPAIAALIWGSIKTTIVVANNSLSYFDKITTMIADIGRSCPTLDEFGKLYTYDTEVQIALCDYYAVVVRLCTKIVQVQHRSLSSFSFSGILSNFELDFKPLRDDLERAEKHLRLRLHLASQQLVYHSAKILATDHQTKKESHGILSRIWTDSGKEQAAMQEWRLRQDQKTVMEGRLFILNSLSEEPSERIWSRIQSQRVLGTAEWFKLEDAYQQWRIPSSAVSVLWCSGMLGVGKSILLSSIVVDLQQSRNAEDDVSFYFCQTERRDSLSARYVIGSIARQLLKDTVDKLQGQPLLQLRQQCQHLDTKEIFDLMDQHLTFSDNKTYYIVLDGLDECPDGEVTGLLSQLQKLQSRRPQRIKILYSSRPEFRDTLLSCLPFDARMSISREKVERDNRAYIDWTLQRCYEDHKLKLTDQTLLLTIADALERECDGMFLWLVLFVDELCDQDSDAAILDALKHPPRGLSDLYTQRFRRVRAHGSAAKAINILRFAGITRRPLHIEEMREVLGVGIGDKELNWSKSPRDMQQIVKACCGLVVVDEQDDTLHYVHISLRTHLFNDLTTETVDFQTPELDIAFGCLCLTYLNFKNFDKQLSKAKASSAPFRPVDLAFIPSQTSKRLRSQVARQLLSLRRERPGLSVQDLERICRIHHPPPTSDFAFLRYANHHWFHHLKSISPIVNPDAWSLFRAFLSSPLTDDAKPWLQTWFGQSSSSDELTGHAILWAINMKHHALTLHHILYGVGRTTSSHLLDIVDTVIDKDEVVLAQLKRYAETIQQHQHVTYGVVRYTLLHHCARVGRLKMVDCLLKAGFVVDTFSSDGDTPLQAATANEHPGIVKRLLLAGSDPNLANDIGETALHIAALRGFTSIVKQLLTAGAVIDIKDGGGCTALYHASGRGHTLVVKCLLAAGANVNAFNLSRKWTALHYAAYCNQLDTVHTLLAAGANVHACSTKMRTVLHESIDRFKGYNDIIDKLLDAGAYTHANVETRMTAFQLAAEFDNTFLLNTMLAAENNVNAVDHNNCTFLQVAVGAKNISLAKKLLAQQADPNIIRSCGVGGALHYAAFSGHVEMILELLGAGADVNAVNVNFDTALLLAAKMDHFKIIGELIRVGATVNATNLSKETALGLVVARTPLLHSSSKMQHRKGSIRCIRMLIDAGADVNKIHRFQPPLSFAARAGDSDLVKRLLKFQATASSYSSIYTQDTLVLALNNEMKNTSFDHITINLLLTDEIGRRYGAA